MSLPASTIRDGNKIIDEFMRRRRILWDDRADYTCDIYSFTFPLIEIKYIEPSFLSTTFMELPWIYCWIEVVQFILDDNWNYFKNKKYKSATQQPMLKEQKLDIKKKKKEYLDL